MKRVDTNNLLEVIKSNMAKIISITIHYSSNDDTTETIEHGKFIESLGYLQKSGIFSDCMEWKYERIHTSDNEEYIIVHSGCWIFTMDVKLCANDGVNADAVEKKFRETIFDKVSA